MTKNRLKLQFNEQVITKATIFDLFQLCIFARVEFPDSSAKWYGHVVYASQLDGFVIFDRIGHSFERIRFSDNYIVTFFDFDRTKFLEILKSSREQDAYFLKLEHYKKLYKGE